MIRKEKDKFATIDSYSCYKILSPLPVGIKDYVIIVNEFFKFIMQLVINGEEVKLPNGAGTIKIQGKQKKVVINEDGTIKGAAPNWNETKKLWLRNPQAKIDKKIIYCLNEHTNGIRYTIHWCKINVAYIHQQLYSLQFTKTNKRDVHKSIVDGKEYTVAYR